MDETTLQNILNRTINAAIENKFSNTDKFPRPQCQLSFNESLSDIQSLLADMQYRLMRIEEATVQSKETAKQINDIIKSHEDRINKIETFKNNMVWGVRAAWASVIFMISQLAALVIKWVWSSYSSIPP